MTKSKLIFLSSSHFASCGKIYSQALKDTFALALMAFSKIIKILLIDGTPFQWSVAQGFATTSLFASKFHTSFFGLHSAPMRDAELKHGCTVNSQK